MMQSKKLIDSILIIELWVLVHTKNDAEISQGFSNTMQRCQRFLSIRDHPQKTISRILDMLVDVHRSPSEIPMLWDIPQLYGYGSIPIDTFRVG